MNNLVPASTSSAAEPGNASTVSQASAIPYRTASAVSIGDVAGASVITVFVLVLLVGFLIYARRRGWIAMAVKPVKRVLNDADLSIVTTKRLSVASVGHVVSYRGNEYLIVESGKGVQTSIAPLHLRDSLADKAP